MRKLRVVLLFLLCAAALSISACAYGPSDLTIPDSAETIVYGQSGAGRDLMAYRFGDGDNVIVVGFAIHGYEDNWTGDGGALVYTAGKLMEQLDQNMGLVEDWGWSVYVLPCMNPDGLLDGYSHNGPGRCTTTYLKDGKLVTGKGIDMNRSFPTRWTAYTSDRNFNGSAPLASKESAALAQFVQDVKGSGNNVCIDTHGWMSQIITSNGYSALWDVFKSKFPNNTYANCNNGRGYFTAYTASLGYASCLFEFPDGIYSMSQFQRSGYCEDYCDCILSLLPRYGTYDPKPVEPEDPHLAVCPTRDYQDVLRDVWYHDAVDYVVEQEIMLGSSGYFEPDAVTTRAMMVEALWRAQGDATIDNREYEDQIREWVYAADGASRISEAVKEQYVSWLIADPDEGIWSACGMTYEPTAWYFTRSSQGNIRLNMRVYDGGGYAYTLYSADWNGEQVVLTRRGQLVSKEQAPSNTVTIDTRDPNERWTAGYSDVFEDMICTPAVRWATQQGIVNGYEDGTFRPDQLVSRQELATILYRTAKALGRDLSGGISLERFPDADQVADYAREAVSWACGKGYIQGSDEYGTILLLPEGGATRAQMAAILMRFEGVTAASSVTAAAPQEAIRQEMEPNIACDGEDLEDN